MPACFRLEWLVPYEAGELMAKGYDAAGQEILTTLRRTTGEAAQIVLRPSTLNKPTLADEVIVVAVEIRDANGDSCPLAANLVTFDLQGPA
jgi:hypothetical protein